MNESTRDLLVRGIAAAKAKEYEEARRYLEWMLRLDPTRLQRVEALIQLAEISTDPVEKRNLIEEAIINDPAEPRARRMLAVLSGELNPAKIVDPDRLPAQPAGVQKVKADRFICPNCGSKMVYSPDGTTLVCESCESKQRLAARAEKGGEVAEESFTVAMATLRGHIKPVAQKTFTCQGCGASFLMAPQQLSLTCPFCDNTYVVENPRPSELVTPAGVVPFMIDATQARHALNAWLRTVQFSTQPRLSQPHGFYLPIWSFDMGGKISWVCEARTRRDQWERQTGEELIYYNDLLVPATRRLSRLYEEELRTYDLSCLMPFEERSLAGWPAETYSITVSDAALEARRVCFEREQGRTKVKMIQQVRNLVFSSLGIIVESFKLLLLPAWLAHYTIGEKRYNMLVNGQTGAVRAEKPGSTGWLGKLLGER